MRPKFKFLMALKIAAGITFFIFLFGFGTMSLWNWLVPTLFHGPLISFGQAVGLLILCKVLFGGFGRRGGWGRHGHCGGGGRHHYWKQRMKERWSNMSEEEKQQLKNKCRGWWDESCWEDKKKEESQGSELQNPQ